MERQTFLILLAGALCGTALASASATQQRRTQPAHLSLHPELIAGLKLRDARTHSAPPQKHEWVLGKQDVSGAKFGQMIAQALKPDADLRPDIKSYGLAIRDQGYRKTCSVFALTFLLEYNWAAWGEKNKTHLSEEYLNWATNKTVGNDNDGDFFSNISKGFKNYGVGDLALAPYLSDFDPAWQPSKTAIDGGIYRSGEQKFWVVFDDGVMGKSRADLDHVCSLLDNKVPVAIGQSWPNGELGAIAKFSSVLGLSFLDDYTGPQGGHSMVAVGYKRSSAFPGGGYMIFRNSWGASSGDEGYWILSFNYVRKYAYDAYAAGWDGIK